MGQVYSFQDPLPIFLSSDDQGPCFDHDHDQSNESDYIAEDGWPDPGPCIICGAPHTTCVGPTLE